MVSSFSIFFLRFARVRVPPFSFLFFQNIHTLARVRQTLHGWAQVLLDTQLPQLSHNCIILLRPPRPMAANQSRHPVREPLPYQRWGFLLQHTARPNPFSPSGTSSWLPRRALQRFRSVFQWASHPSQSSIYHLPLSLFITSNSMASF